MTKDERILLDKYQEKTGVKTGFLFIQIINAIIEKNLEGEKKTPKMNDPSRLCVHLSEEAYTAIKEYCQKTKTKMSPTLVKGMLLYVNGEL